MADGTIQIDDLLKDISQDMYKAQEMVNQAMQFYKDGLGSFSEYYLGEAISLEQTYSQYIIKKLGVLQEFYGQAGYFVNYSYENLNSQDEKAAESFENIV